MGLVRGRAEVRPYDFQRPHQLSTFQLDAITLIIESFLRGASNFLSTFLRTPVQLQQVSTVQMPYEQYANTIVTPTVLTVFTHSPQPGSALIECGPEIALAMIDRALGGPGFGQYPPRELTEIEQTIFRRIMERLLDLYRQSWTALLAFTPHVETIEHNPAFAQIAGEGDLVAVVRQQIALDGHRGQLIWVWPYTSINPFAVAVSKHGWGREEDADQIAARSDLMIHHMERAMLQAQVILGRSEITLGEFSQLKAGDVVVLKNRYDKPLVMAVSGVDKFHVVPGRSHGHLAVRVVSRLEEERHG